MIDNPKVGDKVWYIAHEYSTPILVLCTIEEIDSLGCIWVDEPVGASVLPDELWADTNEELQKAFWSFYRHSNNLRKNTSMKNYDSLNGKLKEFRLNNIRWINSTGGKCLIQDYKKKQYNKEWFNMNSIKYCRIHRYLRGRGIGNLWEGLSLNGTDYFN